MQEISNKVQAVKQAIEDAKNEKSKLTHDVIAIGGFTSNRIRHLLNNLGAISNRVFEIGSHRGSTLCATIYGNENIQSVVSVDNFCEFNTDGNPEQDLLDNLSKFSPTKAWALIKEDCFQMQSIPFEKPDLYSYDGLHADWAQRDALVYFYDMLPDEFIYCVDDSSWESVKKGMTEGVSQCGFDVLFEEHLWDGREGGDWWNGFSVFLLKKRK